MAIGSLIAHIQRHPIIETSRFPGWVLHVHYTHMGELVLSAKRKSDGRQLQYLEPFVDERDARFALARLTDKLGADFLDLAPRV